MSNSSKRVLSETQKRALLIETAKRIKFQEETKELFDFTKLTHAKQLKAILDPEKRIAIIGGRRGGKTQSVKYKMKDIADKYPGGKILYIAKTRIYAKELMWEELINFFGVELNEIRKSNEVSQKIWLKNGAQIWLGGCKDNNEISKFRGHKYVWAFIDEAQDIKKYILEPLLLEVLEYALMDYQGGLWLTGTPNASCSGVFKEACHGESFYRDYVHHHWTIYDNPYIQQSAQKTADELLADICRKQGVSVTEPKIQREFLGKWVKSTDNLVYQFNYNVNVVDELPSGHEWRYVMGVDLGLKDGDAIVILAYSRSCPDLFIIEEWKKTGNSVTDLAKKIKEYDSKYKIEKKVMDEGGLGAKIGEELRKHHSIIIEATKKTTKFGFIKLMNDDFIQGKIKLIKGKTSFLIDEYENLLVDQLGENSMVMKEDKRFENHLTDAALYAWRFCHHYRYTAPAKQKSETELEKIELNKYKERIQKQIKVRKTKNWWE